mgnify:CR=1 FL=1
MAEMLLINPRRRRKVRKARPAAKRRVARRARRRNPVAVLAAPVRRRRRNPIRAAKRRTMSRRRRNPISLGGGSMMNVLRDALIGGAGAVAFDVVHGQIARFLPASLQRVPGSVGAGDAVRAIITVAVGQLLSKPTRGLSKRAAAASLTVQAHDIIKTFVPASMPLGFASPAMIAQGTNRVGPIRQGVNAYTRPGATPLLSAYTPGNVTPLLNGAREREGARYK